MRKNKKSELSRKDQYRFKNNLTKEIFSAFIILQKQKIRKLQAEILTKTNKIIGGNYYEQFKI